MKIKIQIYRKFSMPYLVDEIDCIIADLEE